MSRFNATGRGLWVSGLARSGCPLTHRPNNLNRSGQLIWYINRSNQNVLDTLPELLKTREVLEWEYRAHLGKTPAQAIAAMEDRMNWMRQNMSDYEVALPRHEIEGFARGEEVTLRRAPTGTFEIKGGPRPVMTAEAGFAVKFPSC